MVGNKDIPLPIIAWEKEPNGRIRDIFGKTGKGKLISNKYLKKYPIPTTELRIPQITFSVPGVDNMFDNSLPVWLRCLWAVAIVVCVSLAVMMINNRMEYYNAKHIVTEVQVERKWELVIPRITLCPAYLKDTLRSRSEFAKDPRAAWRNAILARTHYLKTRAVLEPCKDKKTLLKDGLCFKTYNISQWLGLWGRCVTISFPNLLYRGPETYFLFRIPYYEIEALSKHFMFVLHERKSVSKRRISMSGRIVKANTRLTAFVTKKIFQALSTPTQPCTDDPEKSFSKCLNRCLKTENEVNLTCRLPFTTNMLLPLCTLNESLEIIHKIEVSYLNLTPKSCSCTQSCTETIHSITTTTSLLPNGSRFSELKLVFQDNLIETVREEYLYDIKSLLGDIGGILGLLLGFCALNVFEIFQLLIVYLQRLKGILMEKYRFKK